MPILLLALSSAFSGCYCTAAVDGLVHTTGPWAMQVRQTPNGEIGVVYADSTSAWQNPDSSNIHVYQVNIEELSKRIATQSDPEKINSQSTQWLRDEAPAPDVYARTSENGLLFRVSQQRVPGEWVPKLTEKGVKLNQAPKILPKWFGPAVEVVAGPGRTFIWKSPQGPRSIEFYDVPWQETHPAGYLLMPPAFLLDVALFPIEAPIWIINFHG